MANKKIEKALYGPSATEVALGAVLGLAAGLLAACVYLVFKPVITIREFPKEPVRGAVYFQPGNESKAKSAGWSQKIKAFTLGTPISLNEDEANAWSAFALASSLPAAKPAGATPPPADPAKASALDGIFNLGTPNFKFGHAQVQVGVKCVLNWFGVTHEVMIVSTGAFQRQGDEVVFVPDSFYLGSCPVHLIPGVQAALINHLVGRKKIPDEIKSAWAKVNDATVEGNVLKISME